MSLPRTVSANPLGDIIFNLLQHRPHLLITSALTASLYVGLQVAEHSKRKLVEMEAVHERFKQVVQKKDASHQALLAQLRDMQLQCSRYEEVLQQQQLHMEQLVGS